MKNRSKEDSVVSVILIQIQYCSKYEDPTGKSSGTLSRLR